MVNYNLLYFDRSWLLISIWELALNRITRFIQGVLSGLVDKIRHFNKVGDFIVPAKSLMMLASTSYSNSSGTLSWTHTVDGGTDCLIVFVNFGNNGAVPVATFGAASLDCSNTFINGTTAFRTGVLFLKNPPAGSGTITITSSGANSGRGFATNWVGTQEAPFRGYSSTVAAPGASTNLTPTSAAEDVILDVLGINQVTGTPGSGQVALLSQYPSSGVTISVSRKPGLAGATPMSWTFNSGAYANHFAIALKGS